MIPVLSDLRAILDAALQAADPQRMVTTNLRLHPGGLEVGGESAPTRINLGADHRIPILAIGKAAVPMAAAAAEILGNRLSGGLVITKHGHADREIPGLTVLEAGHPVPDAAGMAAADAAESLVRSADADTVILVLLSGGGSSLLADPFRAEHPPHADLADHGLSDLGLSDLQTTSGLLLASGAPITEVNCIRKHLSRLKGGRLAELAAPARVLSLVLSDVIGDDLSVIASGPTSGDPSSFADALAILDRYSIRAAVPHSARAVLEAGAAGHIPDTPGPEHASVGAVTNLIVGSGLAAIQAAMRAAEALGYGTRLLTSGLVGEAREMAGLFPALARDLRRGALDASPGIPAAPPFCFVAGGETTVTLGAAPGSGGRNQELGLAVLLEMSADPDSWGEVAFASLATDGTDGPTDAAGAIFGSEHLQAAARARARLRSALDAHDALPALQELGALLRTGPTGTNVNDIQVLLLR